MSYDYSENILVQESAGNLLKNELGWNVEFAYNTEVLGKAFEPEEFFENPDGTPITFDTDYFGGHRGAKVIPGPFAEKEDVGKNVNICTAF